MLQSAGHFLRVDGHDDVFGATGMSQFGSSCDLFFSQNSYHGVFIRKMKYNQSYASFYSSKLSIDLCSYQGVISYGFSDQVMTDQVKPNFKSLVAKY